MSYYEDYRLPSGYPSPDNTYYQPNSKVAKVNGGGNKIGPGIVLKVMAEDHFSIQANSWYKTNGATPQSPKPLMDLISALSNDLAKLTGSKFGSTEIINSDILTPSVNDFLENQPSVYTRPKAYLN